MLSRSYWVSATHNLLGHDDPSSPGALPHVAMAEGRICGFPTRLFRVSFKGELGFEVNVPAATTRGFGEAKCGCVGESILKVVDALAKAGSDGDAGVAAAVLEEVRGLCRRFPIYQ